MTYYWSVTRTIITRNSCDLEQPHRKFIFAFSWLESDEVFKANMKFFRVASKGDMIPLPLGLCYDTYSLPSNHQPD